jgi:hypothetical protein
LSSPLASTLLEGDAIENLRQLRESHALALFRRIQNQSATFTEADRQELMDLASNAVNGGFLIDTMQMGIRLGANNHEKGSNAREGRTKKADVWRASAEELTTDLWREKPHFRGNFSSTAAKIRDDLKAKHATVPKDRSVADHLSAWAKQQNLQF